MPAIITQQDDIDLIVRAFKRDGFKVDGRPGPYFSFSEFRDSIEKDGYRLFWMNFRWSDDSVLVRSACNTFLVAYRAFLRCVATSEDKAIEFFTRAAVKFFSPGAPNGNRLGRPRSKPVAYNGWTLYDIEPRLSDIDLAPKPFPIGDAGNFWSVASEFDIVMIPAEQA